MSGNLVLSRKNNEGIIVTLPNNDTIKIVSRFNGGKQVAISFEAPDYIEINRSEIENKINSEVNSGAYAFPKHKTRKSTGRLVISRKDNESFIIKLPDGEKIQVLMNIKNYNRITLSFSAPRNVEINREEIERRKENNKIENERIDRKTISSAGQGKSVNTSIVYKKKRRVVL